MKTRAQRARALRYAAWLCLAVAIIDSQHERGWKHALLVAGSVVVGAVVLLLLILWTERGS